MSNYLIQGKTLTTIADKVRSKLDNGYLFTPEEMPSAVDEVFEAGKKAFIYEYVQANNGSLYQAFYGPHWTDETYLLTEKDTLIVAKDGSCNQMYTSSRITDTKITLDISKAAQTYALFSNKIVTVRKVIVSSNNKLKGAFLGCNSLVDVTIEGTIASDFDISSATKLSKASITNIFGCLSTETSGLTVTISKTAVKNAFPTSVDAEGNIIEKNEDGTLTEWGKLRTTKSNWTISFGE